MSRRLLVCLLVLKLVIITACAFSIGKSKAPQWKSYKIIIIGNTKTESKEGPGDVSAEMTLKGSRISVEQGCVLLWRDKAIDTIVCEPLARIMVTELN